MNRENKEIFIMPSKRKFRFNPLYSSQTKIIIKILHISQLIYSTGKVLIKVRVNFIKLQLDLRSQRKDLKVNSSQGLN
jgi:hypothetical protein